MVNEEEMMVWKDQLEKKKIKTYAIVLLHIHLTNQPDYILKQTLPPLSHLPHFLPIMKRDSPSLHIWKIYTHKSTKKPDQLKNKIHLKSLASSSTSYKSLQNITDSNI